MSTPKELRERFSKTSSNIKPEVADLLGIISDDMHSIIVNDIKNMISKQLRLYLDGYIFCLSRIINHNLAWEYITEAFSAMNEKVPSKYLSTFGKSPEQIKLIEKGKYDLPNSTRTK